MEKRKLELDCDIKNTSKRKKNLENKSESSFLQYNINQNARYSQNSQGILQKLCTFQDDNNVYCEQLALQAENVCKNHVQNGDSFYFSIREKEYKNSKEVKAEKGDLKFQLDSVYKYDLKQWRKCCVVCFKQARPIYCKAHDPNNIETRNSGASKIGCQCIDLLSKELQIPLMHKHFRDDGLIEGEEHNIPNTKFYVDAYDAKTKRVWEFLGGYYHGDPSMDRNKINHFKKQTMGDLHDKTFQRLREIASRGFEVFYIWESAFKVFLKNLKNLKSPKSSPLMSYFHKIETEKRDSRKNSNKNK